MTEFGDVNVGDKVRLTNEDGELAEFKVIYLSDVGGWRARSRTTTYLACDWPSVEVLEPAPKPLPTEPGFYQGERWVDRSFAYHRDVNGVWRIIWSTGGVELRQPGVDLPLVALVPVSAVEEARSAVVAEIVEWLQEMQSDAAAHFVEKRFGGKA